MFTVETCISGTSALFREPSTLETVANGLLPQLDVARKVACIGCSRGQEVYSLAALARRSLGHGNFGIDGFDNRIDRIRAAREGIYEVEPQHWNEYQERMIKQYFGLFEVATTSGTKQEVVIPDLVRAATSFGLSDIFEAPLPDKYPIIVCANVLYHYSGDYLIRIIQNIKQSLNSGGYLVCETRTEDLDFDLPGRARYLQALSLDQQFRDQGVLALTSVTGGKASVFQLVN